MSTDRKLTPRQARFVEEYLIDLNATQAAIRAGYSDKAAHVTGPRLLGNASVSRAIEEAIQARSERTEITADWVLENLRDVAVRCQQKEPVMVFDRAKRAMVQATTTDGEGVWQFDAAGANRALELIGKHLGMFKERVEHTGKDGGPIQHAVFALPPLDQDDSAGSVAQDVGPLLIGAGE